MESMSSVLLLRRATPVFDNLKNESDSPLKVCHSYIRVTARSPPICAFNSRTPFLNLETRPRSQWNGISNQIEDKVFSQATEAIRPNRERCVLWAVSWVSQLIRQTARCLFYLYRVNEPPGLVQQTKQLTQRERNREAVRNCRKRKREQALKLLEKVDAVSP